MKVSILIPVYGVERYIETCVRSLMEQTYHDIEYIFVNDCTPDDSITILRKIVALYSNRIEQVRIIDHEKNKGLGAARKTSLNYATGDAVLIVDSDDYLHQQAVELLVRKMQETKADIIDGGFALVSNGVISKQIKPSHLSTQTYLKRILCQNIEPYRIWGRLISRSLFINHHIDFHEGIDYGEDFSVVPILLINGSRTWVDDTIYYYRDDSPSSYTNNISTKSAVSFFKANQFVGSYMKSHRLWKEVSTATQIGWIYVQRFARQFNIDVLLLDQYFTQKPSHPLLRIPYNVMRSNYVPKNIATFLYKTIRKVYLLFA